MVRYVIAHFVFSNSNFVDAEMKNKLNSLYVCMLLFF